MVPAESSVYMKYINHILFLTFLIFSINSFVSCRQHLRTNEFNIYVSEDNPGWHFVDLSYDTIQKGNHRIEVKFAKGQKFQPALIRSDIKNYRLTFLYNNGDTVKGGLWFLGEYNFDSLQRKFIQFYMPSEIQRAKIKDYMEDSIYESLRYEMDTIVRNYLRSPNAH